MEIRLAFCRSSDEQFLVNCEIVRYRMSGGDRTFTITAFADENEFIQRAALAELPQEATVELVAAVLMAISGQTSGQRWVRLTLTAKQWASLGLRSTPEDSIESRSETNAIDLHDVLMQTPMPFSLLTGPEHRFAFMNQANAELLLRSSTDQFLGKTIREALPELKGQPFFSLLDKVYRSGETYVGREVEGKFRNDVTGEIETGYFDFIYYPVRDGSGEVCGIMAQATNVTERVLEQLVCESREEQLYRQWVELDTIYKNSPMGMCLLDVKNFRILRLNAIQAEMMGTTVEAALGQPYMEIVSERCPLRTVYERVVKGEEIRNYEFQLEVPRGSGVMRTWLVTCSPSFDEAGQVETIASIEVEITDRLEIKTDEDVPMPTAIVSS